MLLLLTLFVGDNNYDNKDGKAQDKDSQPAILSRIQNAEMQRALFCFVLFQDLASSVYRCQCLLMYNKNSFLNDSSKVLLSSQGISSAFKE